MRPYRVKHIPTGFYFQPYKYQQGHLSKNGKVYFTPTNGVNLERGYKTFTIRVFKDTKVFKEIKDKIEWKSASYYNGIEAEIETQFEDWVQEEI